MDDESRPEAPKRWQVLPAPVPVEQMICVKDVRQAPDPEMGRDANQEWMLKYA